MPKIRHIAYRAEDVEAMAAFFCQGLGMEIVQRRNGGAVDLSDGAINITLLPMSTPGGSGRPGIEHIGFTAEDEQAAKSQIEAAGGRESNTVRMDTAHYEYKFVGPEGIIVDVGHWAGTAPVGEPALTSNA